MRASSLRQGLDTTQIQQFKQIINDICTIFETTLLYGNHYKDDIPECVTRSLRMENGQVTITRPMLSLSSRINKR